MKTRAIKRRNRPIIRFLYISFWTVMIVMFAWLFVNQMESYNDLQAQLTRINANIEAERAENYRLTMQLTFFDSDMYVEQLARDRLGMIRPGEIVFRNIAD